MEKLYNRIDWHNNTSPAINETNLNRMSKALDDLDDRVILIAGDVLVTVPQLREMLEDCTELEARLEAMTENPPYIGANGHWYIWDTDEGAYVDSGIDASITVEIADITMLDPSATPYVTNTGTDTDPVFHLFIPRGQPGKGISNIAKTGTSGYVDTYTITYTDNTSTTYTVTNGRNTDQMPSIPTASASLVGTIYQYIGESTSSYTHGFYYECVNDGGVYKWVNIPVGNDPVAVDDTDPYTYRQGKGNLADMEIVGASVGWNQYIPTKSTTTVNGITFTVDNTAHTITISGTASANAGFVFYPDSVANGFKGVTGHKYLYIANNKGLTESSITHRFVANGGFSSIGGIGSLTSENYYSFKECVDATKGAGILLRVTSGTDCTTPVVVHYPNLIDLTLLFGSTVADAIYAMEQATAGAGVAFFRKYFPKDYYAYDAGSIQSVCVGSRKVVGFNQWDEEWEVGTLNGSGQPSSDSSKIRSKNFCELIGGRNYYIKKSNPATYMFLYDADKNYLSYSGGTNNIVAVPSNAKYFKLRIGNDANKQTTYNYDVCINLSDTAKNGTYEPYTSTAYPFDSTKEIRGMFNLVGGELKANGDIYSADGNIQRKYGIVDLGTLDWTYSSSGSFSFRAVVTNLKQFSSSDTVPNIICAKYPTVSVSGATDKSVCGGYSGTSYADKIAINDSAYSDAATFKTAMSGVYLVYELATPTTESAQPYQNPQRAYIDGTEEFTDGLTRDVMIPVGNNTVYQQDKILPSVEDYVDSITDTKTDISAIAPEENGATSSKAYTIGQHFYKDGKFCTAIAAIASNAAFTLNTNYVEGTIAEAIESIQNNSGHTIVNSSGSSMTARSKLKFANATVTDDPANDQTVITTNPASAEQTATLATENFMKHSQDSGVYYITRSGFCEIRIKDLVAKAAGQGLLVAGGIPNSAFDGIIMGTSENFEDGTAFYINKINGVTKLYALIPDTNPKYGSVLYMTT